MSYVIVFVLLTFAVLLLFFALSGKPLFSFKRKRNKKSARKAQNVSKTPLPADGVIPGCCPLCKTPLLGREKIQSVVFEGGRPEGRLCRILGCPHCRPPEQSSIQRICPVCRKKVPQDGYLTARMFERKDGSHHVHILGCTECRKKN